MHRRLLGVAILLALLLAPAALSADDAPPEVPLWPNGAPGSEQRKDEKEVKNVQKNGEYTVTNVHNPSLTVFLPPKDKATGAAVVLCPGGGHRELWVMHEGVNEAKWLNEHGIAAFVLKYRLAREKGSPYKVAEHALQDGQRAVRLVRSRAKEWGIDPHRVGMMGFSAGGEVTALVCDAAAKDKEDADDPVERQSARPDFQALVYSGPQGIVRQAVTKEMPPTFIVVGDNDNFAGYLTQHYLALKKAGVPAELHVYAGVPHGFGFRGIDERRPVTTWIVRFEEFLGAQGMLKPDKAAPAAPKPSSPTGIFENNSDVGTVLHPGSVTFDTTSRTYTVAGSGENMWGTKDAFHYVWKKATGDLALTADVSFLGEGKEPHRKACLVIRQGLGADDAYVDAALHGDGLTSLQFRDAKGAATHEVQANVAAPARLRVEKRGKYVLLYLASKGEELRFSGAAVRLSFEEPFYVGLGVCAHNKDVIEKAVFSNAELTAPLPPPSARPVLYSTLETQAMSSTDRRVVYVTPTRIEAPNWLRDGKTLIYNSGGRIYRIPAAGGKPEVIDTGFATRCNNDHGLSPDGTLLAISDQSQGRRQSLIYTLPVTGGTPTLVTPAGPSYWHGWSPDGKTLVYCGERDGEFDIYSIPAAGGRETRLTTAKGLDDGPEFSPDGKLIYFNSDRTGRMQIWRMKPDGSDQEQVTDDEHNNWFPHPSPDGRRLVILSYEKDVTGHPENKDVTLRLMTLGDKTIDVLGRFLGGQGTVNVPCWSPDGRRIAFVTYQLIP
jgi:acetyl esterase/lipase